MIAASPVARPTATLAALALALSARLVVACSHADSGAAPTALATDTPTSADAGVAALDGASSSDGRARAPGKDRPINRWVLEPVRAENNQWETSIVYEPITGRFIRHQGHELATYAQTSGTWAFSLADDTFVRTAPPVPPPRICLVSSVYADSVRSVLSVNGRSSHGSMPVGGPNGAFTGIGYKDSTGPRLYDPETDRWFDARPPGAQWGTAPGTPLAYEAGSDLVVGRSSVGPLALYSPRTNRVTTQPLPDALVGRRGYGIAADPDRRKIVLFGGTGPASWASASDPEAAYDGNAHDDTWIYDAVTGEWREAHPSVRPPKGVPFYDFLEVPMIFHPPSGTFLLLQVPIDHYSRDAGPATWPPPELWSFDLDTERWTKIPTEAPPLEIGRIAYDSREDALVLFGGGRDGDRARPSLSTMIHSIRVEVLGRPNLYEAPVSDLVATTSGSTASLRWSAQAGATYDVERAPVTSAGAVGAYAGVGQSSDGSFADAVPDPHATYAYRVRRRGQVRASVPAFTSPMRPVGLDVAVRDERHVTLTWTANREADIVGYHVFRARGSIAPSAATELTPAPITTTTFEDDAAGLSDGVLRAYWIVAENASGQRSGPSAYALTAPPIVEKLDVSPTPNGKLRVAWAWPHGGPVTFSVYRNDHHENTLDYDAAQYDAWMAEWKPVGAPSAATFVEVDPAGGAGAHDYFYVRARNALGQEGYLSDIVSPNDGRFAPYVRP